MAGWITNIKGLVTKLGLGTSKAANTGGLFNDIGYVDVFADPAAASTSAATSTLITPLALSDAAITHGVVIAQPDFPRNLTVWCSAANTGEVTLTGLDQSSEVITETVASNGAAIVPTTKVFATLIAVDAAIRSGGAATLTIGVGSILGTSRRLLDVRDGFVFTTANGKLTSVRETTEPLKSTTTDVHGVTFTTALAATKTYWLRYGSDEAR